MTAYFYTEQKFAKIKSHPLSQTTTTKMTVQRSVIAAIAPKSARY